MTRKFEEMVAALVPLAMGKSMAATARHAEVSAGTVKAWLADPAFVEEVDRLRPLATAKPMDGLALLAAVEEARGRLRGFTVNGPNSVTTHVRIPAHATPAQRRRILARALAKSLVASMEAQP